MTSIKSILFGLGLVIIAPFSILFIIGYVAFVILIAIGISALEGIASWFSR